MEERKNLGCFQPVLPEDAATVILVRETKQGLLVYMTRRHERLKFLPGFHVFPGGKVDGGDSSPLLLSRCRDLKPEEAVSRLPDVSDPHRAMSFFVAAARELFEEAGVLLAEEEGNGFLETPSSSLLSRLAQHRVLLQERRQNFLTSLEEENCFLSLSRLLWFAHWITPATSPRRFNTYFFLAKKPMGQEPSPFSDEIESAGWVSPREALEKWKRGEWSMIPPTVASLDCLSRYDCWASLARDFLSPPNQHPRTVWTGS